MPDNAFSERLSELETENLRLRRLLAEGDVSDELRNRQRVTLGMLRTIIRRSADKRCELDDYVAHLLDRLDAMARAQQTLDRHGAVDLHTMIAEQMLNYRVLEGERFSIVGPVVRLKARAGQVVALALHELALNALEHGALQDEAGTLAVRWQLVPSSVGTSLNLEWCETKSGGWQEQEQGRPGFGQEALTRMLPFELDAATHFLKRGRQCCWTIDLPLTESVWVAR